MRFPSITQHSEIERLTWRLIMQIRRQALISLSLSPLQCFFQFLLRCTRFQGIDLVSHESARLGYIIILHALLPALFSNCTNCLCHNIIQQLSSVVHFFFHKWAELIYFCNLSVTAWIQLNIIWFDKRPVVLPRENDIHLTRLQLKFVIHELSCLTPVG